MNLYRLWFAGILHPTQAFEDLKTRPAPQWGFWVVVILNLLISATTLVRYLIGDPLVMASWLTFLPDGRYLLAETFFLLPLRVMVYLATAAIFHAGLRLVRHPSDFDQQLNIGGLNNMIILPVILLTDWIFLIVGRYPIAQYTHSFAPLWGLILNIIGLRVFFGTPARITIGLTLIGILLTIPILAIFAR
jgi:hypothetical protein